MQTRAIPTDAELTILNVLWREGPCTVRDVHDRLSKREPVGYTTVLKMMQVMFKKELVTRDDSERSHVYRPARSQERTQNKMVTNLMDKAFAGSAADLAVRALSARKLSPEELQQIRDLLHEKEQSHGSR